MGARQFHKLEVGGSSPSSATIVRRTLSAKLIEKQGGHSDAEVIRVRMQHLNKRDTPMH